MPRFKRIPREVEAIRLTSNMQIENTQGVIEGKPGDWLVTGIEGEQYIIPHSRFSRLYEPADGAAFDYLDAVTKGESDV